MNAPSESILIPASDLLIDPELQARSRVDAEHVERLARTDPKTWDPLVVTPHPDKRGKFAIIDGAHRFLAGQRLELPDGRIAHLKKYSCVVMSNAGYEDSFSINSERPLSLSKEDRKAFVFFLKENFPSLSNREISRRCGLSSTTVDHLVKQDGPAKILHSPNYVKQFVGLLVKAYESGEASGFFGLGEHRAGAIVDAIQDSKDAGLAVKAVETWTQAAQEALAAIKQGRAGKDRRGR